MGIKSKFCAKCGKESNKLADGICIDCRFGESVIAVPKKAILRICKACGAVDFEGLWVRGKESEENYFENILIKKIKIPENAELDEIKVIEKENTNAKISVAVSMDGQQFKQEFLIRLNTRMTVCPECSMHRRKQYVAMIQLRDSPENIERMLKLAETVKPQILKFEELKTGVDIYFISKESANHLASELRRHFKLWTKLSSEAYSWDQQKNRPKYKLVILMRARE